MRFLPFLLLLSLVACQADTNESPQPSSNNSNSPGFRLLSTQETGIDFSNDIKENFQTNLINLAYIYNGGGVCILDYDQDGLPDIFFVSSQADNKLFRNLGGLQFEDVSTSAGIAGATGFSTGASIVDINADGFPDIYICRSGIDNTEPGKQLRANLLFVNQQDGSFQEAAASFGLNSNRPATQAYWFDYDNDGDLDCYLINTPNDFLTTTNVRVRADEAGGYQRITTPLEEWESDQLFRNDGSRFTDVSAQAGINNRAFGLSAVVLDINEDGLQDIYVCNDYIEPDNLFINQGNGTFVDRIDQYFRHTAANTMGSDLGDINNDGLADMISLDMLAEDPERRLAMSSSMVRDRFETLVRLGYGHQYAKNILQLNQGNGIYSDISGLSGVYATDWSWAPLFADFDNDRFADLFISNGYRYDIASADYTAFTADSINRLGGITPERFPDFEDYLKLIPSEPLANYLYHNQGNLKFENVAADWGVDQPSFSTSTTYADLDQDGDLELVVSNIEMQAFVYQNLNQEEGSGQYLRIQANGPASNPRGIGLEARIIYGDEQQVKSLFTTRGFLGAVEPVLHFGLGDIAQIDRLELSWPDGSKQVINQPNLGQVLTVNHSDASTATTFASQSPQAIFSYPSDQRGLIYEHRENVFNDFDRERLLPYQLSQEGPALVTADFTGDGLDDVFIGAATGAPGQLFHSTPTGFQSVSTQAFVDHVNTEDIDAAAFDADGDGDLDLYVVSGGAQVQAGHAILQDRLYMNDGSGNFSYAASWLPIMTFSGGAILVTDLNQDQRPDLIIGGRHVAGRFPTPPPSKVLLNTGNNFRDATTEMAPELASIGMITSLTAADLDGDGTDEILVAGDFMALTIFRNQSGKLTPTSDFGQLPTGLWNSLHVFDADGDGDLDLLAGNEGQNARFHTSEEEPLTLFADDFDGNGSIDPVLACYQNGQLCPLVRRDNIIAQIPELKEKFVRNNVYASAKMDDIFSPSVLAQASQYTAQRLATTLYRNDNGNLVATELPAEVQMAPVNSVISTDLNGDGALDLVMVGNDYGPEVETGRYDASNGIVLLNDGSGNFSFAPNRETGFWACLNAREVAAVKMANNQDGVVVANSGGPAAIFVR